MPFITTPDGVGIFYKDWGSGPAAPSRSGTATTWTTTPTTWRP